MEKEFRNQIVGVVRFSYVTTGDFYPGFDTTADMEHFLFDADRLDRRFQLFEKICLPALKQQTDAGFFCVFLTSMNLPDIYMERLLDLLAPLPNISILPLEPMPHYDAVSKAFKIIPNDGYTHRTTFRLDDDDGVDDRYIARLKANATNVAAFVDADVLFALTFNRGFYVEFREGGNKVYDARERTPLSVGAALVAPVDFKGNVYAHNHRALPQYFNTYSDATDQVFLRTIHQDNKSKPHFSGSQNEMTTTDIRRALRIHFRLDVDELLRL